MSIRSPRVTDLDGLRSGQDFGLRFGLGQCGDLMLVASSRIVQVSDSVG
ncbi:MULTISPECIES: hypothetical protein [Rhodococcus erythropolis group]|nr:MULTISPECIES: hypothetical protein [Rhodococcus erythropolis group]MBO8149985.1 hypothetical protein [Rhodococcus erythropolis]MDO1492595.1 hypothetical protein [Rhodococcus erythropolis]MYV31943.1 hypothetical protein [Rhodococcus erythropolis]